MLKQGVKGSDSHRFGLQCKSCGNSDRFLEIMDYESHTVNGDLVYLHLVDAIVEEYRCCKCGKVVRPGLIKVNT